MALKDRKNVKILIVDDDVILLDLLKQMLYDFNLRMATNGMEAVEKFKSFEPDIVLMDIVMPVIDGIEATKEILRINKEAKVIAITAYERQRGMEMIRAGAVGILEKPFRKKDLIELINNYI